MQHAGTEGSVQTPMPYQDKWPRHLGAVWPRTTAWPAAASTAGTSARRSHTTRISPPASSSRSLAPTWTPPAISATPGTGSAHLHSCQSYLLSGTKVTRTNHTNIIPTMPISYLPCQYHTNHTNIIPTVPISYQPCQYHTNLANIIPTMPISYQPCQYHTNHANIIPTIPIRRK